METAKQIAIRLYIPIEQRSELLEQVEKVKKQSSKPKATFSYRHINEQDFKLVDEWYYFAILGLAVIPNNSYSPKWVADRLNITRREAELALKNLESLRYIKKTAEGGFVTDDSPILKTTTVTSVAMQRFHKQVISLAQHALENEPIKDCLFSFRGATISQSDIPEVKEKIKSMQEELISFLKGRQIDPSAKVYSVNVQLFPIDKGDQHNESC